MAKLRTLSRPPRLIMYESVVLSTVDQYGYFMLISEIGLDEHQRLMPLRYRVIRHLRSDWKLSGWPILLIGRCSGDSPGTTTVVKVSAPADFRRTRQLRLLLCQVRSL